jgi:heme o synthase
MNQLRSGMTAFRKKFYTYWPLVKGLQTGLLVATGLGGYMSARCPIHDWATLSGLFISLVTSISGSTILNMWWDRDLDAKMTRTQNRPLVTGNIQPQEALWVGLALSLLGVGIATLMNPFFGLVIFAGVFFDVVVYTIWLKRRTCWSIIIGGLAGGMPILAGRVLGLGSIDWVGVLLTLAVLLWIPTHIMTFSMKYHADYKVAGVPTFPSTYGFSFTRTLVALSSVLAALSIGIAAYGVGMTWGYLRVLIVLSTGLFTMAISSMLRPSERINFGLFKYASLYMLSSMLLMVIFGILDVTT